MYINAKCRNLTYRSIEQKKKKLDTVVVSEKASLRIGMRKIEINREMVKGISRMSNEVHNRVRNSSDVFKRYIHLMKWRFCKDRCDKCSKDYDH